MDNSAAIRLSEEHSESRWVTASEAEAFIDEGRWLKTVIRRAEAIRRMMPAEMLSYYRGNGFEI